MITVPTLGVFPSNSADIAIKNSSPRNGSVSVIEYVDDGQKIQFRRCFIARDPRFTLSLYNLDSLVSILNEAV